ncbi:MAG: choice-of-anchor D domain-containing protein, partial [Spirochaetota bacterium]
SYLDTTIRFTPSSTGAKTAIMTFTTNDPNNSSFALNLSGTCVAAPAPNITIYQGGTEYLTGGTFQFGTFAPNTPSSPVTFSIENIGTLDLSISGVSLSGTDSSLFSIDSTLMTTPVIAGDSTTFTVTFQGAATAGVYNSAVITINTNDLDTPAYTVILMVKVKVPK